MTNEPWYRPRDEAGDEELIERLAHEAAKEFSPELGGQ